MYAVIQTGGKQYRVQPGDVLVVEKIDGDVGAEIAFDRVLMMGGEGGVTVGAPLVDGAVVTATLIETRKGKKIKVFKKIRRQGYRRTNGHRQPESVLRVTGLSAGDLSARWDGEVDLTPRAELVARARGLTPVMDEPASAGLPEGTPSAETPQSETATGTVAAEASAKPARARKAAAPAAMVEQPVSETPAEGAQTSVDPAAAEETGSQASVAASEGSAEAPARKPRARKAKPADDAADGSAE